MEDSNNGNSSVEREEDVHKEDPDSRLIDYEPDYHESYSKWCAVVIGCVLIAAAEYVVWRLSLSVAWAVSLAALAIGGAALWRHDSNRELQNRIPPDGWKSVIKPDKLVNMELSDFDELMRFELKGDDDDDLEDHRVPWASRYSRDVIFISWGLLALAAGCLVAALVFPSVTVSWNDAELPQTYNLVPYWLIAIPVLLIVVWGIRFDWHYRRLMFDESQLYILKENPAWLPWTPGQNDPIPLALILSADPVDTEWGKRWGHGTVLLRYQLGFRTYKKRLRRVPAHRTFCNKLNSARVKAGASYGGMGMGMMY
jgi:hypothetical protein